MKHFKRKITISSNELSHDLRGWNGIFSLRTPSSLLLSLPPHHFASHRSLDGELDNELFEINLQRRYPEYSTLIGPAYLGYSDRN